MKHILKSQINYLLQRFNLRMVSAFNGVIAGQELEHDLPLLIHRNGPVCLDVGANLGQTADLFNRVFTQPSIYCFEPSTQICDQLRARNLGEHVTVVHAGVGKEEGELTLNNMEVSQLSSFLQPGDFVWGASSKSELASTETVPVITIDSFVQKHGLETIDILKSDTQGFELNVLQGANSSLRAGLIKNVLIEVNFIEMYQNQGHHTDIFQYLNECGFYCVDLYEKVRHPSQNGTISWCTALFGRRDNDEAKHAVPAF